MSVPTLQFKLNSFHDFKTSFASYNYSNTFTTTTNFRKPIIPIIGNGVAYGQSTLVNLIQNRIQKPISNDVSGIFISETPEYYLMQSEYLENSIATPQVSTEMTCEQIMKQRKLQFLKQLEQKNLYENIIVLLSDILIFVTKKITRSLQDKLQQTITKMKDFNSNCSILVVSNLFDCESLELFNRMKQKHETEVLDPLVPLLHEQDTLKHFAIGDIFDEKFTQVNSLSIQQLSSTITTLMFFNGIYFLGASAHQFLQNQFEIETMQQNENKIIKVSPQRYYPQWNLFKRNDFPAHLNYLIKAQLNPSLVKEDNITSQRNTYFVDQYFVVEIILQSELSYKIISTEGNQKHLSVQYCRKPLILSNPISHGIVSGTTQVIIHTAQISFENQVFTVPLGQYSELKDVQQYKDMVRFIFSKKNS